MAALHVCPGQAAGPYLVPRLSGRFQNGLFSCDPLPAHDPHIDVLRIEFDGSGLATGAFGGNQERAAPREWIEDDPLRWLQSRRASAMRLTGLTVGCRASSSYPLPLKLLTPE